MITQKLAYTREETARLLSISPSTLDRLAKSGVMRPTRVLGRPVYTLKEIQRVLEKPSILKKDGRRNNGRRKKNSEPSNCQQQELL